MLAITSNTEDKAKTEAFIAATGAEYTYGYFHDDSISKATEQKGYPHAALIDPSGTIVWTGHPARLTSSTIEEHLKGAAKYISFGWPTEFESVAKEVHAGDFAKALAAVDKLAEKGVEGAADVRTSVVGMLDAHIAEMNAALQAGDFLEANRIAEWLDGNLKGLDQAQAVEAVLDRFKSDKDAKQILGGQAALAKVMNGELRKDKQLESAISKAEKLAKKYPGTIVETQANEFIARLRVRLQG